MFVASGCRVGPVVTAVENVLGDLAPLSRYASMLVDPTKGVGRFGAGNTLRTNVIGSDAIR